MISITLNKNKSREYASNNGWTEIDYQDNIGLISFKKGHFRMNVYITRMTVVICNLETSVQLPSIKKVTHNELNELFFRYGKDEKRELSEETILEIMNKHVVKRKAAQEIIELIKQNNGN